MQGGTEVNAHALTLQKHCYAMHELCQEIRTVLVTFFPPATVTVSLAETGRRVEAWATSVRAFAVTASTMFLALPAPSL